MSFDRNYALITVIALLIGVLMGISIFPAKEIIKTVHEPVNVSTVEKYSVGIYVPAVDSEGRGVATRLTVETMSGEGRILSNIDKLVFWVDTQSSIQTAENVAENYTGINTDYTDIIYSIRSVNATLVGGPSAGAALTLATIAALQQKQPNNSVMITGTINEEGEIGPVGGVLEKARAAKSVGATLFLVPVGEGTEKTTEPVEKCVQKKDFVYCETKYETETINIGESLGIEIKEVATISDAARYFL